MAVWIAASERPHVYSTRLNLIKSQSMYIAHLHTRDVQPINENNNLERANGTQNSRPEENSRTARFIVNQRRIRSHRKSRRGCYECKERRIKVNPFNVDISRKISNVVQCSETWPTCNYCARRDLNCQYLKAITTQAQSSADDDVVEEKDRLGLTRSITDTMLNLMDLKLFHHFMLYARPYLPLGYECVWVSDVPARAQEVG
jgi:hypothetical protein